jgi:biopolymer transport protein ExbD
LPSAKKTKAPSKPPKIARISVDITGKITMDEQTFQLPALKQTLTKMFASDAETAVVVKGASDTDYQYVVSVLDVVQQVGITKVGLATETVQ